MKTINATLVIEQAYHTDPDEWVEVDEYEFLRRTEWAHVFAKGTALAALRTHGEVRTPYATFRLVIVKED
jgi:hypothetical protein